MAHGLEIYSVSGAPVLRYTDELTRLIDSFQVGQNSSGSRTYSGLSTIEAKVLARHVGGAFQHVVSWDASTKTVSWSRPTNDYSVGPTYITIVAVG